MDENKMGWREHARYAEMSVEELARDCEVQVFRATGPGGHVPFIMYNKYLT